METFPWNRNSKYDIKIQMEVIEGAEIGGAVAGAASAALSAVGFTSTGVAAGSMAAAAQSAIGVVEAGSLFAMLQSLGATGAVLAIGGPIAMLTGGLIGLGIFLSKKSNK